MFRGQFLTCVSKVPNIFTITLSYCVACRPPFAPYLCHALLLNGSLVNGRNEWNASVAGANTMNSNGMGQDPQKEANKL